MTAASMARGLSLLGQTFSGKNKQIEEVLVRGKNIDLPAGVELYVQIKTPIVVYGVKATSSGLSALSSDEMNTIKQPSSPAEPQPALENTNPTPPAESELSPEEMNAQPPKVEEPPAEEVIIERVDPEPAKPAPTQEPPVEPRPDEGKTPDGKDGEIIEIFDEE